MLQRSLVGRTVRCSPLFLAILQWRHWSKCARSRKAGRRVSSDKCSCRSYRRFEALVLGEIGATVWQVRLDRALAAVGYSFTLITKRYRFVPGDTNN